MSGELKWVVREFIREDAAKLARLLNESEEGWPGGLTGGVPYTAERVLDEISRSDSIAHYVAEVDGELVGYLKLNWGLSGRDASYVALVNVHPRYRGRGIGTSLLKRAIERSLELGLDRVDLHTWPGNEGAIRLYKRLGFFWVPKTHVYMQNYLPMAAKLSVVREALGGGLDALLSFKRVVKVREDDVEWRGRGVYVYEWKVAGGALRVRIDRDAWGICSVEWGSGAVECYVEGEVVRGVPLAVTWRLSNQGDEPVRVALLPRCDEGVRLLGAPPATVTLKPGDEVELRGRVAVSARAPHRADDEPSLSLRTLVVFGRHTFELAVGLRGDYPVTVGPLIPAPLTPGFVGELPLTVRSNVRGRVACRLKFAPSGGLDVEPRAVQLDLAGRERVTVPLKVVVRARASRKELIKVLGNVSVRGVAAEPRAWKVPVAVLSPGETSWHFDEERGRVVIYAGRLCYQVDLRGGRLRVIDTALGDSVIYHRGESLGPPFWPNELERARYECEVSEAGGAVKVTLSARPSRYPGLELRKTLEVRGGPLLKVAYEVVNESGREYALRLKARFSPSPWLARELAIPLGDGVLRSRVILGEFPSVRGDLPTDPGRFGERWSCYSLRDGLACGLLWPSRGVVELDFSYCELPSPTLEVRVPPHSAVRLEPIYVYVGPGSWRDVRAAYYQLAGGLERPPELREVGPVEVSADSRPLVLPVGPRASASLVVRKRRGKALKGVLRLRGGKGLRVSPPFLYVSVGGDEERIGTLELEFREPRLGVYPIAYELVSNMGVLRGEIPVVRLHGDGEVKVWEGVERDRRVFVVDNGLYIFKCSPDFGGCLYSIRRRGSGADELLSSFPEPRPWSWMRWWHGGVRPRLTLSEGDVLWRERWDGHEARLGEWVGVELWAAAESEEHEELRSLRVRQYYLTRPGSNVLLLLTVVENPTRRYALPSPSYYVFASPGGKAPKGFTLRTEGGELEWVAPEHGFAYLDSSEGWAVVWSDRGAVALVAAESSGARVGAFSESAERGCHMYLYREGGRYLRPGERLVVAAYLVIASSASEAKKYACLRELRPPRVA